MREVGLLAASVAATLVVALALIRWLAPGLLGLPVDLQVVQVQDEVAPFYDTVFEGAGDGLGLIRDPYTGVRARPLVPERQIQGPHDLLGFRNEGVPNRADVIAIGDSQTYGVNTRFASTWPRQLAARLEPRGARLYAMAASGWSAVQYLDLFEKSRALRPKVVVVAFYTGNDPRESFRAAYSIERWKALRPDASLDVSDLPPLAYPPPPADLWTIRLRGETRVFAPKLRLLSNEDHPAVRAGWTIMGDVGRRIADGARDRGVAPVFTIIPTKELAFAPALRAARVDLDPVYARLVRAEQRTVASLADRLAALPGARYVDLVGPLQQALLAGAPAYRTDADGHPLAAGHAVIAAALGPVVSERLSGPIPR